jgi:hypothetical protein
MTPPFNDATIGGYMVDRDALKKVIDLGEKATKGPWMDDYAQNESSVQTVCGGNGFPPPMIIPWMESGGNRMRDFRAIAHYRTAAPEMARMLLEIHEVIDRRRDEGPDGPDVYTEVTRILGR